jgi:hypothetical protein
MYGDVQIATATGNPMLAVPDSAVIDTGTRKIVILDVGEGAAGGGRTAEDAMMHGMMREGMIWGMGFAWLLVVVVLILSGAALIKYLFLGRKGDRS